MIADDELLLQAPTLPTLYFDGYGAYRKVNGVLRCVAYVVGIGGQYNIITSLAGADQANRDTRRALDETASTALLVRWQASRRH